MAVMYPNIIDLPALPFGEMKCYNEFKRQLNTYKNDDFHVYHSVCYFMDHKYKNGSKEGESDFIIIHPYLGLLLLEVKGGEINYNSDRREWTSKDNTGNIYTIKDPFIQAQKNVHNFVEDYLLKDDHMKKLIDKVGGNPFSFGYAVCFPDCVVESEYYPPHEKRKIIIDSEDLTKTKNKIIDIMEYFNTSIPKNTPKLNKKNFDLLRRLINPDFKTIIGFRKQQADEELFINRLTDEQTKLVTSVMKTYKKLIVKGSAGTGKTLIVLYKAIKLAEEGKKVLLICFNDLLGDYLKESVKEYKNITANNFHKIAKRIIESAGIEFDPSYENFWKEKVVLRKH